MSRPRARVLHEDEAVSGLPLTAPGPSLQQRRRVAREELEGRLEAERIVQEAQGRAEALLARAREDATRAVELAARAANEEGEARLAARWVALRAAEGDRLDRDAERIVAVAKILTERVLGAALELTPARIADLARGVLAEARGARRATVEAHPADAEVLRSHLSWAGLDLGMVEVRQNETLARGELLFQTDVGTIDAKLTPRLDRLAEALRDVLR